MILKIYTDSSFSHTHRIAACGYVICNWNEVVIKHEVNLVGEISNSTAGESYAIYLSVLADIKFSPEKILIYSDCKSLVSYINSRISGNKKNGRKRIHNIKEWEEWTRILNELNIPFQLHWVKGHSKSDLNNKVDRSCREYLRKHLKTI